MACCKAIQYDHQRLSVVARWPDGCVHLPLTLGIRLLIASTIRSWTNAAASAAQRPAPLRSSPLLLMFPVPQSIAKHGSHHNAPQTEQGQGRKPGCGCLRASHTDRSTVSRSSCSKPPLRPQQWPLHCLLQG